MTTKIEQIDYLNWFAGNKEASVVFEASFIMGQGIDIHIEDGGICNTIELDQEQFEKFKTWINSIT